MMTQSKQLAAAAAGEEEAGQHWDAVVVVVGVAGGVGVASEQVSYKLYQIELTERTGEFGELRERERGRPKPLSGCCRMHAQNTHYTYILRLSHN